MYIYSHCRDVTTNIFHELLISLIRITNIANYNQNKPTIVAISLFQISDITNSTQRYHYLQITVNSACHRDMHAAKQWCERRHIVRHYDEQDTNIQCLCFSDIAYRDIFIISTQTAVAGGGVHRRLSVCLVVCLSARYLKKTMQL